MSSYTQVFGGSQIEPAQLSYLALDLDADTTLVWPLEAQQGGTLAAAIIDITPSDAFSITMPDARLASTGQTNLFNNLGPDTVTVKDADGNTLLSLSSGTQWFLYLTDNTTEAGEWRSLQYGSSVSQAQASALAGYGLKAIGSMLAQAQSVVLFNSNYTAGAPDRASLYVWNATGAGTLTLPTAASVGDDWFIAVRNGGGGNLTLDPQGSDTINDAATLVLQPGDSAFIGTDGTNFYTVGFGQQAVFAFDYTAISLTGQANPYTLSGSELNRIAYKFTGVLAHDESVVLPTTTQQYWVDNSTTGGSFLVKIGTLGQVPFLTVPRGSRGIYYCDGTSIVKADTASIAVPIAISDGGTGATTAGGALINLGGTAVGIAMFQAATAAAGRAALSAAASGSNSDITELTGLTTPLIVAEGGTGVATLTGLAKFNGTAAAVAATAGTDYAKPDTASTWTAKQTFNGGAAALAAAFKNATEPATISATAATGTIAYNILTQSVLYYTSNAAANWTVNLRGDGTHTLDSLLATGDVVTVVHLVTQGVTPFYNNVVQVDGTAVGVTTKWQGGTPTGGTASGIDVYTYAIVKTGAATFTVLASVAPFL